MIQIRWFLIIIVAITAIVLFSACGQPQAETGNAPMPTATNGPVTLEVAATSYHTNDTISVTLKNQETQTIYFIDHLTNCTVLLLQRQVNGNWIDVNICESSGHSTWHTLDAGQTLNVKLTPPPNSSWSTGLYRATLSYRLGQEYTALTAIYSAGFQVIS